MTTAKTPILGGQGWASCLAIPIKRGWAVMRRRKNHRIMSIKNRIEAFVGFDPIFFVLFLWCLFVVLVFGRGCCVVAFSLAETCSLGQQPASKVLRTKIKLDFRPKHLRHWLLTAPVRTLSHKLLNRPLLIRSRVRFHWFYVVEAFNWYVQVKC